MHKFKLLKLISVFSLLIISCNKNDDNSSQNPIDELPPATQTGENTFGCLINGEAFEVTNTSNQAAIYQGGLLQFSGSINDSDIDQSIAFNLVDPLNENQTYFFDEISYKAGYTINTNELICIYEFDETYQGSLTFSKIDLTNFIVSGTFEFSTVTGDCEMVNITNGRFDLQYIP